MKQSRAGQSRTFQKAVRQGSRGEIMKKMLIVWLAAAVSARSAEWPVLKTYEGEYLRRVKMPLGGIGTGTISLAGNGSLVHWEIRSIIPKPIRLTTHLV